MERALDLDALAASLGVHPGLPRADELQRLMVEAEISLLLGVPRIDERAVLSAWYLLSAASNAEVAEELAPPDTRRAFRIAGHVFDLAASAESRSRRERLQLAFGAQLGYRRGGLEPNATAVWRRFEAEVQTEAQVTDHLDTLPLEAGVTFLGLQPRAARARLRAWRNQFDRLRTQLGATTLTGTLFGPTNDVVLGCDALMQYLVSGRQGALDYAREVLSRASRAELAVSSLDAQWVAGELLRLTDHLEATSVWSCLPPDVPGAVRQALTVIEPQVLTMWPPQVALLGATADGHHVLSPEVRRLVLAVPTSAGKTLMAQLLLLSHLASDFGSVCYVAPMRSLGREVRSAVRARLRVLQRELGRDLPDVGFLFLDEFTALLAEEQEPQVDVMTPERLAHLLRTDGQAVLDRYSLFIFDEAQLIGEGTRGFVLETVMSYLVWRTRQTHHRIAVLSAALGNRGQIRFWLDPDEEGVLFEEAWRGARRLHGVFSTTRLDAERRREPMQSAQHPWRDIYPVRGDLTVRPARSLAASSLHLTEPVGELSYKVTTDGRVVWRPPEQSHSTPHYRMVARLVAALGHAGSILIVCSTRAAAQRMAVAIAELVPVDAGARLLSERVRAQLGEEHPLPAALRHGVGFHHAGLPTEILEGLETGVRDGTLHFLVCTSTLTEGVNLPVHTVVLAETRYEGQPADQQITGARLINAMGRAGRAGKESEGWVIQALAASSPQDFAQFEPGDEELVAASYLTTDAAIAAVEEYEQAVRAGQDAIFSVAAGLIPDFVSFIWFLLASEEELGTPPEAADLEAALSSTLAFHQLPEPVLGSYRRAAAAVRDKYSTVPAGARRRWSRTGTSITSARALDELASALAAAALDREDRETVAGALEALRAAGVLAALFQLSEAPSPWEFKPTPRATTRLTPDPLLALELWLHGVEIPELAAQLLTGVRDADHRLEQMVDAVASHFEHFLAWTLGVVLDSANQTLEAAEQAPICPELALFVRYGVDSNLGLDLMTRGVHSRSLVHAIASDAVASGVDVQGLQGWLAEKPIEEWREQYGATPIDVLELLEYARNRSSAVMRSVLSGDEAHAQVFLEETAFGRGAVTLDFGTAPSPPPVEVRSSAGELIGRIAPGDYRDVAAILGSGLPVDAVVDGDRVAIKLAREDDAES